MVQDAAFFGIAPDQIDADVGENGEKYKYKKWRHSILALGWVVEQKVLNDGWRFEASLISIPILSRLQTTTD